VKPCYWILVDDLSGAAAHRVDLAFQFAPLTVTLGPEPWARAQTSRGRVLWVGAFASTAVRASLASGELRPLRGWVAPTYGERVPAPALTYSATVVLPWRVLTLLIPDAAGSSVPPDVRVIRDANDVLAGVRVDRRDHLVENFPCESSG